MKRAMFFVILFCGVALWLSANVGKLLQNVSLADVNNNSQPIPFLGEKVLLIFYVDPDVEYLIDPLVEAINVKKYPTTKFGVIGAVNCKDTWIPNQAILREAQQKQLRYPGSVVLLDKNHTLAKAWNLGECDNLALVLLIGKDAKVNYSNTIQTLHEHKDEISKVCKLIEEEIR